MPINAMYPSLTAMQAFGLSAQNTAHNLANVATEGFVAGRMTFEDLPGMSGTAAVGPTKPNNALSNPQNAAGPAHSTTDVATEFVNLIVTSRGYQANAKTISTVDKMLGTVVNIKV